MPGGTDAPATLGAAGADGLPSNRQIVAPASSPATWQFHMIQPVVLNQWKRSPRSAAGPMSLIRSVFRPSSITPPWPCTIGLGRPVVPLE